MKLPIKSLFLLYLCGLLALPAIAGPEPAASSQPQQRNSLLDRLTGGGQEEFLRPEQAFKLAVTVRDAQTLVADFEVTPGYYLYRERTIFKLAEGTTSRLVKVDLPPGEMKRDPNFGDMEVYHGPFQAVLQLQHSGPPGRVSLEASYQGCSDKGLCYAPIKQRFDLDLATAATAPPAGASSSGDTDDIQRLLGNGKLWLVAAGFFGFGLLLSLTPCVLPMIPILSGIIVGQGQHPSRAHAFNLSLAYTLGMAITYALAGIAAGLSGQLLSTALQNAWVLGTFALLFVVLALSMFGLYELKLPSALESRVADATNRIRGGRFLGVFAMGALSALIVSPCVAAPLAGALLYIGQTHDVVLGGVALFMLALGMGVPLLAVGLSAGALLPKTGAWMNTVSNFFGVLMLGMAIWIVSPVLPPSLTLGLWAALLIIPAIFLRTLDALPPHASRAMRFGKGVGVIALVAGIALLVGAFAGSQDPLRPLAGILTAANSASATEADVPFKRVKNLAELDAAVLAGKGRPVMLDFYADWCVSCKEYERYTFADPRVRALLDRFVLLQADVTANSADDAALLNRFKLFGPPGIVFYDVHGQELAKPRIVGYQDADHFLVTLNEVFAAQEGACATSLEC